jgi:hypothetical protein
VFHVRPNFHVPYVRFYNTMAVIANKPSKLKSLMVFEAVLVLRRLCLSLCSSLFAHCARTEEANWSTSLYLQL